MFSSITVQFFRSDDNPFSSFQQLHLQFVATLRAKQSGNVTVSG